jgi:hypothetical protein
MVIKPFKVQPKIPANFIFDTWTSKLQASLRAVYRSEASSGANMSKEELYRVSEVKRSEVKRG